jgi:cytoskeletal protein CcmA (bactofilin family)
MAMFDLGKRSSGSEQGKKGEEEGFARPSDLPREGISPPLSMGTARSRDAAIVGPSIHIEGTLRGEEDLIIEGRVNGTVKLQGHSLTVGSHGQISADIYAHTVVVEGTVEGDLFGAERVVIKKSANIRGNITSPRVSLEDGARFKGAIEMDPQAVEEAMGTRKAKAPGGQAATGGPVTAPSGASTTSSPAADKGDSEKSSSGGKVGSSAL